MSNEKELQNGVMITKIDSIVKIGKRHRDKELNSGEAKPKRQKVSSVVYLGHGTTLSARHISWLTFLGSIINGKKTMEVTDLKDRIICKDESSKGLHLEWVKETDSYFLWLNVGTVIAKFDILAVLGCPPEDTVIENPLIVFSTDFDDKSEWAAIKTMFAEIFSGPDGDGVGCNDDLIAFTKVDETFHLCFYKVRQWPTSERQGLFQQAPCSFVLKPVGIIRSNVPGSFSDNDKIAVQGDATFYAPWSAVPHPETILHIASSSGSRITLPAPLDTSEFEGLNTTLHEYFERYHAYRKKVVPGTGVEPVASSASTTRALKRAQVKKAKRAREVTGLAKSLPAAVIPIATRCQLCQPFKVFARGLITFVGDTF